MGVDAVCCQAFYIETTDTANRMTYGFLTTASNVLEDYGVEVEFVQQDQGSNEQYYVPVQYGAEIIYPEEMNEASSNIFSFAWASFATAAFLFTQ